jgi:hypothetical protein
LVFITKSKGSILLKEKNPGNISTKAFFAKGSIIAIMVTIPSLGIFGISWYILDDLFQAAIIGGIAHLIAMGFSFKISKKLFIKKSDSQTDL